MDIDVWLHRLGLGRYARAFRDNDVDAEVLASLTGEDLKEIGVASVGHRRRLLEAARALRADGTAHARAPGAEAAGGTPESSDPGSSRADAERRQLTVMFVDLVGSTALSARLDPEEMAGLLRAYRDAVVGGVARAEGHVTGFLGDGVLCYFGWPEAQEDAAERAAGAALALVAAVGRLDAPGLGPLACRVGIATGLVVVGEPAGEGAAREGAAVGGTPNLAARLQAAAGPGEVLVDTGTRRLLGAMFECRDLGRLAAKGFPEPVPAWRVQRLGAAGSRSEALHATAALPPLLGREEELGLLRRRWARARRGEGGVVLLSGEPGIGKSRLAAGLAERLGREPHVRLRYFCSPHHQDSPLLPVIRQIERAAGLGRNDAPAARAGARLRALLARGARDADGTALIADLLGLPPDDRHPLPDLSPEGRKERLLEALLARLAGLAARRPVLVLVEDAHWIDPTSLELLGLAVERVRRLRALLVVTSRPGARPAWAGLPHVTVLALGGLGRREAASLVRRTAGGTALADGIVDEIVDRAGGVPLFAEELTKAVAEADWHEAAAEGVLTAAPLPACAVPAVLYAPLAARLDRLGRAAREVAQTGAAIGREFSYDLLAAVARRPDGELRGALDRLVGAGLLLRAGKPPRVLFLFKHSLVQDTAYGTLLRARRRELHARIAAALESLPPETAEARPELLAHHHAHAGEAGRAVDRWGEAGRLALARSAAAEAAGHLRRALGLLPALPDTPERWRRELELLVALGTALAAAAGTTAPETGRAYDRARALCERLGDTRRLVTVANGQCTYHLMRAEMDEALEVAGGLLRRAAREDDPEARLAGHRLVGAAVLYAGRLRRARRHLEAAAGILDAAGEGAAGMAGGRASLVLVPANRATLLLLLGRYDEARTQIGRALAGTERLERWHLLRATALAVAAWHHVLLGEDAPRHLLDALRELVAEQGFRYWATEDLLHRGLALLRAGVTREGLALVREGAARYDALGAAWHAPVALCLAAGLAGAAEGPALVAEASARFGRTGVRFFDAEVRRVQGALLADGGDARGAEARFAEAIGIARGQGAGHWELRATVSLARHWRDRGRTREARDLLAPVSGRFAEGLDTPDLREARALLGQLG